MFIEENVLNEMWLLIAGQLYLHVRKIYVVLSVNISTSNRDCFNSLLSRNHESMKLKACKPVILRTETSKNTKVNY